MAQHVNIEESAAHTKHIITVQSQLPARLLASPLTRQYVWEGGDTAASNAARIP